MKSFSKTTVLDCDLVDLGKVHQVNGNLTVVENAISIPFDVERVYYLYDVPGGAER